MSEWISVKDRLPEKYTDVLCYDTYGECIIAHQITDKWCDNMWSDSNEENYEIEVTHWMLLPEPPKKEQE